MRSTWMAVLIVVFGLGAVGSLPADDEKLRARVAKIDKKFYKALAELAEHYDKVGDPEAAHFFAECFVGFNGAQANTKIGGIRAATEISVYMGKVRGGTVFKNTGKITGKLRKLGKDYKKVVLDLVQSGLKSGNSKAERAALLDCVLKTSICNWGHDYVRATQRINEIRGWMGLRAVLWGFAESKRAVIGCWYMGETGYTVRDEPDDQMPNPVSERTRKFFWNSDVEFTRENCARGPEYVSAWPDKMRASATLKEPLLNPDARRLMLGHWEGSYYSAKFPMTAYDIPWEGEYRKDIPTPSSKYTGSTVVKGWVDTEETIDIKGRKVIFVRYPYKDEPDAPYAFSNGQGHEGGWQENREGWPEGEQDPKRFGSGTLDKRGQPIMLRFFAGVKLTDLKVSLTGPGEEQVPYYLYRDGDKRVDLWDWPTILILPKLHLKQKQSYTVSVSCKVHGAAFEETWKFTTRAK